MRLLLIAALATVANAQPVRQTQALRCPDAADTCDLYIAGKLVFAQRDAHAKWDNLRISTALDGKDALVFASINIPHRTELKLKAGTSYRFKISARKPFGAGDLWVVDAKQK